MSWKKLGGAAVSMASVTLMLFAGAQPAAAEGSYGQCPNDRFCVWTNNNGTGKFAQFEWGSPDLAKAVGGYVFNDTISSVWNRTPYKWCLYEHKNWNRDLAGKMLPISVEYRGAIDTPRTRFNDITSSLVSC